jgi:hypothetical protein
MPSSLKGTIVREIETVSGKTISCMNARNLASIQRGVHLSVLSQESADAPRYCNTFDFAPAEMAMPVSDPEIVFVGDGHSSPVSR